MGNYSISSNLEGKMVPYNYIKLINLKILIEKSRHLTEIM
jgi:hypothetical protein